VHAALISGATTEWLNGERPLRISGKRTLVYMDLQNVASDLKVSLVEYRCALPDNANAELSKAYVDENHDATEIYGASNMEAEWLGHFFCC